ncbi:MAG: DNA helicase RecQ [Kistimonas sp.]|nr:DNA helicase RecQ [Kistimonas sp.]
MSDPALRVLADVFGYGGFRGQQRSIVQQLLQGGHALVLMPTGGGKSLCYQLPALMRPGTGVVVSPLISLMQDQVSQLQQRGIRAMALHSGLSFEAQQAVYASVLAGECKLLYLAPERLLAPRMLATLVQIQLALFAIDEAHCVAQWGHDFRPEYLRLSVLCERWPTVPRVALTATADLRTRREIAARLQLQQAPWFVSSFERHNIFYQLVHKRQARRQLLQFLRDEQAGQSGIVYCLSRRRVDELTAWLQEEGVDALAYHAGLDTALRTRNQELFLEGSGQVMVATTAFGMGVDKPDVRFVAHMGLPRSIEAYYQETGRAGRDGLPATAWLVYDLQDVMLLHQLMAHPDSSDQMCQREHGRLGAMLAFCEELGCRTQALLRYFGEELNQQCGHCDLCVEPVRTWDATDCVRKALSAVYRTGQSYGVGHLVNVLCGRSTKPVKERGHDRLPIFALGRGVSADCWRSVYRQLLARGCVVVAPGGRGLRLAEQCRPLLRGELRIELRRDQYETRSRPGHREVFRHECGFPDGCQAPVREALPRRESAEWSLLPLERG